MNFKEIKSEELNKGQPPSGGGEGDWHRDICQGVVMAYFIVMAVIYPFYAPGGYTRIGDVKYEFFRNVSLVTMTVLVGILLIAVLVGRDKEWIVRNYRRMSVTDWFAYGYLVAVMVSYLCSNYKEDALWGVEGWYMGAVTQMVFVLIYFLFSRYFHCGLGWIGLWLLAAFGVFLLGICNRYSVYPIAMEGQIDTFISTLGNINWFCGYWSVTAPLGMVLYWCSGRGVVRVLSGTYSVIAILAGVTQGSNSAYLVFIAVYLSLLILSLHGKQGADGNRRFFRFLELCMMFAASCQLGRCMRYLPGLAYNYEIYVADGGPRVVTALLDSPVTLWMFFILALCYGLLYILEKYRHFCTGKHRWAGASMVVIMTAAVCIVAFFLLLDSGALYFREAPGTVEQDGRAELVFDEDWGNGRGAIWNCSIDAFRGMDTLHKIVGAGPDCFSDYIYDVPDLARAMADRFANLRLTNGHNEHITLLVNTGVFGWLCYAGIFLTAFIRWVRKADKMPLLYVCAVSILAYTAHNLVSFQQVLNTPYAFMALGIGERLYRHTAERILNEQQDEQ